MKKTLIASLLALAALTSTAAQAFVSVHVASVHVASVHVAPHIVVVPHSVYIAPRPVMIAPRPVLIVHPVIVPHPVIVVPVHHVDVCDTMTYQQRVAVNAKAGHFICAQ